MDILNLYDQLKRKYKDYIQSFVLIKDKRIEDVVVEALKKDELWPKALVQFNPTYEQGASVNELIAKGLPIHPNLKYFFNNAFYKHQQEAIELGSQDKEFIVTSGTGSGKSRTFMATIFNHILRQPDHCKDKTIAIIVYPMNALINSQWEELNRYKESYEQKSGEPSVFTFDKYTGQEGAQDRKRIQENPPNIILTNYMMLELLMTRAGDEENLRSCFLQNLRFLVFDELHTYRGMQGSDVSFLIRRIKAQASGHVLCLGTSATMVSDESMSYSQQREKVAEVASCIFGSHYSKEQVIDETLRAGLTDDEPTSGELARSINSALPEVMDERSISNFPTAIWMEQEIALNWRRKDGKYFRGKPVSIEDIAQRLSLVSGVDISLCQEHIISLLRKCNQVNLRNGTHILPYKIHQFIPQTGNVYLTLGLPENRLISIEEQLYCEKLSHGDVKVLYYPVVFSRLSGHEFYVVRLSNNRIFPRDFDGRMRTDDDREAYNGYIVVPHKREQVEDFRLSLETDDIPSEWIQTTKKDKTRLKPDYEGRLPRLIYITQSGAYDFDQPQDEGDYIKAMYFPAPMLYDPTAKAIYQSKQSEYSKLSKLGGEGRSTATTILSYEDIILMAKEGVQEADRKVMTFVDARQDAALQAGHFNDFIRIGKIRSAIWNAVVHADRPLDSSRIARSVFDELNLSFGDFVNPRKRGSCKSRGMMREIEDCFINYLSTIIYDDLAGNWQVIMPNLEECALLRIEYKYLHDEIYGVNGAERSFDTPEFEGLDDEKKEIFITHILDYFRHKLCMSADERTERAVRDLEKAARDKLGAPWTLDENDRIAPSHKLFLSKTKDMRKAYLESGGYRSKLAIFVRDFLKKHAGRVISGEKEYVQYMQGLFDALGAYIYKDNDCYQLDYNTILWCKGDEKTLYLDRVRIRTLADGETLVRQPNKFFQEFYKSIPSKGCTLAAKDHTGQVSKEDREIREREFREGHFPVLFCSPTMELGIDIKDLSVVGLRNVPPTPANYTQRAGRAGRNGQAALIYTYCRTRNSHENYYLSHPEKMVNGEVKAPRMELVNEELFYTHLHSTMLSICPIAQLSDGIHDLVEYSDINHIVLREEVLAALKRTSTRKQEIQDIFMRIVNDTFLKGKLLAEHPSWYTKDWIDKQIDNYAHDFDKALDRWRALYRQAQTMIEEANLIIKDRIYGENSIEKIDAHVKQRRGENLRDLLLGVNQGRNKEENEFYPYRYFASEGFLPGYNFTRLPLRVMLQYRSDEVEYLSRPKSLALYEFGPQNIIYNNGGKFRVTGMSIMTDITSHKFFHNPKTGVIYKDQENAERQVDIITGEMLSGVTELIPGMCIQAQDMVAKEIEKITCQEEERNRKYYITKTYFSSDNPSTISECELRSEMGHLANIRYIPSCRLTYILESQSEERGNGFLLDTKSGEWLSTEQATRIQSEKHNDSKEMDRVRNVKLFTETTANAIYIQPLKALQLHDTNAVRTFLYAFKQAIEDVFQVEGSEIGAEVMGTGDVPNILIYENTEGSLGVLNRLVSEPSAYRAVVNRAYDICFHKESYTDEELSELSPADYGNLLNYYNQPYHQQIDIRLIYQTLCVMKEAEVEVHYRGQVISYEEQYRKLEADRDQNSSTEEAFLKYLYTHRLRLPDKAQPMFGDKYFVQPDFQYGDQIVIFCDGTPHDKPEVMEDDRKKRKVLRNAGYQVLVWHYATPIEDFVNKYADLFTPVS